MKSLTLTALLLAHIWVCAQPCTPLGNETSYGSGDVWIGYVYDNMNFTSYRGFVNEGVSGNPNFDQSFGGSNVSYPSNGCATQTETFSVRYKLTKTFASGTYDFTVGADDGYRLSLDGGATWVINAWNDQSYTSTTYTANLNGSYNLVLEYYENGGDNRVTFSVVTGCAGTENTTVYGSSDIWNGYVYDGTNFNAYKGMVHQGVTGNISFDQNFGGDNTNYSTSGCAVQTETFSVRYRLTKNFPYANYTFVVGGDDGYRLSLDGGATWVINRWNDQSYTTTSYTSNLNGNYNLVLEYYENGGGNRISINVITNVVLKIDLLSFKGRAENGKVALDWTVSENSNPAQFIIERSHDGQLFAPIHTTTVGINASTTTNFLYTDPDPIAGISYYRLRMTDREGKLSYSPILSIRQATNTKKDWQLFPSVLSSPVIYCQAAEGLTQASLRLTDMTGRLLSSQSLGRLEGGQVTAIFIGGTALRPGTYLATLASANKPIITQKIVIR